MKRIVVIIITLLLLHGLDSKVRAQSYEENLKKYWFFRYKLVNDFMQIGNQCGESMPATTRSLWTGETPNGTCHLKWSDATIDLAHYIGVLATEYALLKQNNQDCTRTIKELYYALKALERLDLTAEEHCRDFTATQSCQNVNPQEGDLNGFFIRDDIPLNFVNNNLKHFNRPNVMFPVNGEYGNVVGRMDGYLQDPPGTWLTWQQAYGSVPHYPTEVSQDQIAALYVGLSLATYYLGQSETYNYENLKSLAQNTLMRISYYSAPDKFTIRNPLTGDCVYGISPDKYGTGTQCDAGGARMMPSSFAVSEGLMKVNANWSFGQYNQQAVMMAISNPFVQVYQMTKYFPNEAYWFPTAFTSVARSWRMLSFGSVNVSRFFINRLSFKDDNRWPHLPLIYRLIHGGAMPSPNSKSYEELLNLKPKCGNFTYSGNSPAYEEWEWSNVNRLEEAYKRGADEVKKHHRFDESNNLDYMLLFNLYLLNKGNDYASYYNNPYYVQNLSSTFASSIPVRLNVLEYLGTTAQVLPSADVTLRGAKEIVLLPGFRAHSGSKFRAYVEDYGVLCSNGQAGLQQESCVNPRMFSTTSSSNWYADGGEFPGERFVNIPIPKDTLEDYEPTEEEMAKDSTDIYEQIMNSGDSTLIEYLQMLTDNGTQNEPIGTVKGITPVVKPDDRAENGIQIFPNPTSREVFVRTTNEGLIREIKVFNLLGQEVLSLPNTNTHEARLDMSAFVKGTYILRIYTNTVYFKKVVLK